MAGRTDPGHLASRWPTHILKTVSLGMSTQIAREVDAPEKTIEAESGQSAQAETVDWYDLWIIQTFPASDALPLWR